MGEGGGGRESIQIKELGLDTTKPLHTTVPLATLANWVFLSNLTMCKFLKQDALQKLAEEETGAANNPLRDIIVENSGIVNIAASYNLTAAQLDTDGDVDTSSI